MSTCLDTRIIPRLDALEDRNCPSVTGALAAGLDAAAGAAVAITRQVEGSLDFARDLSLGVDTGDTIPGLSAGTQLDAHADAAADAMAAITAAANATVEAGVDAAVSLANGNLDHSIDIVRDLSVEISRDVDAAVHAVANAFVDSSTHVTSDDLGAVAFNFARGFGTGNLGVDL